MKNSKSEFVLSALELVRVGENLEKAKGKLRSLVEQGVPYNSAEMRSALGECLLLQQQWKDLEAEHLARKQSITQNEA